MALTRPRPPSPALALRIVVGAGFLVAPNPLWAMVFYLGMLPVWLPALARRAVWPTDPGTAAGIALIGWFSLTTAWDPSSGFVHGLWLWNGVCTLVLFVALRVTVGGDEGARDRLVRLILLCALANAAIAFGHFALFGAVDGRMVGWAETKHPILGASIMGVCVLLAAGRLLSRQRRPHWQDAWRRADIPVAGAVVAVGVVFIVLTGSRGPLLAIAGALALLLLGTRPRLLLAAIALGAAALGAVALAAPGVLAEAGARLLQRGWSNRLDIWQLALREIGQRPLFGHGPSARLDRATDNFPHDLFLSTLFYSGAVGLLLLLALLALAVFAAARQPERVARWTLLALLAHTVLSGLTDLSQITKGPSPIWYIVWLPVALALGPPTRAGPVTPATAPVPAARRADCPPA